MVVELQQRVNKQAPFNFSIPLMILLTLDVSFPYNKSCWFNFSPFRRYSNIWTIPFFFLLHCIISTMIFQMMGPELSPVRMGKFTPSTQCHNFIPGLVFIPFLYTDTVFRLGLRNHLAERRAAERVILSKCSLPVIVVNKAPVWPVLNCTCVIMHLESPDLQHLRKPCVFLTAVNSELRAFHRPTSSDS